MRYSLLLIIPFIIVITRCGSDLQPKDRKKSSEATTMSVKDLKIDFPDATSRGLVTSEEVAKGDYLLAEILTIYRGKKPDKFISILKHIPRGLGKPAPGDPVLIATDWKKVTQRAEALTPYVEINLPMRLVAEKGKLAFKDRRYYWSGNEIKGDWSWSVSSAQSPLGDAFYLLLDPKPGDDKVYRYNHTGSEDGSGLERQVAIQQVDPDTLTLTVNRIQDTLEILYSLTYKK